MLPGTKHVGRRLVQCPSEDAVQLGQLLLSGQAAVLRVEAVQMHCRLKNSQGAMLLQ